MLSTSHFPFYLFWHNVLHQPPKYFWSNSYFSLLKTLWIIDFWFISLTTSYAFLKVKYAHLLSLSTDSHQHFTINDISSTGPSVLATFESIYQTQSILWDVVCDFGAAQYTVKIDNTKMNPQTCNLGCSLSLFPVDILTAESSSFAETQLAQENDL